MNLNEYSKFTASVNIKPTLEHVQAGIVEELGELFGHLKRYYRDDKPLDFSAVSKEMGDILWYWTEIARIIGLNPQYILEENVAKLIDRRNRNVLSGSGDTR